MQEATDWSVSLPRVKMTSAGVAPGTQRWGRPWETSGRLSRFWGMESTEIALRQALMIVRRAVRRIRGLRVGRAGA